MIGLNLDGNKGEQMFSVSSLKAVENPTNRSNVGVAVFVTDPGKITSDNYNVIYDESNDIWTLTSDSLKTPVTGKAYQLKLMDLNFHFLETLLMVMNLILSPLTHLKV